MIYWFTGQPAHGKTVLANKLKEYLPHAFRIDGDEMRELFTNKDYTINGRVVNVGTAQKIAHYLNNQGHDVIVSLVAPYVDQREDFKTLMGDEMIEFYVHTSEPRERDHFKAIAYVPPTSTYVDIDTTEDTPEESFEKILMALPTLSAGSGISYQDWVSILSYIDGSYTTAVETGTFTGDTTKFLSGKFNKVHTIELDEGLYKAVSEGSPTLIKRGVNFHLGDSATVLKDHLIDKLNESTDKVFFFLDAHWSGDDTVDWENSKWEGGYSWARGRNTAHRGNNDQPTSVEQVPLEEEILHIYSNFKNECVICIDDFDKFDEKTGIGKKEASFIGEDWSHINFNVILEKVKDRLIGNPINIAGNKLLIKFKALNQYPEGSLLNELPPEDYQLDN